MLKYLIAALSGVLVAVLIFSSLLYFDFLNPSLQTLLANFYTRTKFVPLLFKQSTREIEFCRGNTTISWSAKKTEGINCGRDFNLVAQSDSIVRRESKGIFYLDSGEVRINLMGSDQRFKLNNSELDLEISGDGTVEWIKEANISHTLQLSGKLSYKINSSKSIGAPIYVASGNAKITYLAKNLEVEGPALVQVLGDNLVNSELFSLDLVPKTINPNFVKIETPYLLSQLDQAIVLSWKLEGDLPTKCTWSIYKAGDLINPVAQEVLTNSFVTLQSKLTSGDLRWRVKCGSTTSAWAALKVLSADDGLTPPNLGRYWVRAFAEEFLLKWSIVPGAKSYEIEIAKDKMFTRSETKILELPEYRLKAFKEIYWRVRAISESGKKSEWSMPGYIAH